LRAQNLLHAARARCGDLSSCGSGTRTFAPGRAGAGQRTLTVMMEFVVETPGATLAVRESRPDGEPLLMLHGGPGVPDSMQTTVAPVLPQMRGISFDQRGVGSSICRDGRYDIAA